ncbi:hypothetical protein GOODEAATRI_012490, partial [Goodea atripinnis]
STAGDGIRSQSQRDQHCLWRLWRNSRRDHSHRLHQRYGPASLMSMSWALSELVFLALLCASIPSLTNGSLLQDLDEFGYNAETQKLLCKNGETLLGAINFFVSSINTLVNKTMEDTLMTIRMYENARGRQAFLVRRAVRGPAASVSTTSTCYPLKPPRGPLQKETH